jgi:ferredoxin-type protein NapH
MIAIKQLPKRQRVRKALLLVSFLIFPITLYYFSPVLIIQGAAEGILNGSAVMFGLMFLSSLLVGRLWCGWACPAGALQEFAEPINNKRTPGGRFNWIKWVIWVPWIVLIVAMAVQAGGYRSLEPLYQIEGGVTVAQPYWYMIYYIVVAVFLGLALIFGRRAGCHTICWMAPFMIIGRWIRNRVRWPSLRLVAEPASCSDCQTCTRNCPMSLDVNGMVQRAQMENGECILCGNCVDGCPKGAIHFSFSSGR